MEFLDHQPCVCVNFQRKITSGHRHQEPILLAVPHANTYYLPVLSCSPVWWVRGGISLRFSVAFSWVITGFSVLSWALAHLGLLFCQISALSLLPIFLLDRLPWWYESAGFLYVFWILIISWLHITKIFSRWVVCHLVSADEQTLFECNQMSPSFPLWLYVLYFAQELGVSRRSER